MKFGPVFRTSSSFKKSWSGFLQATVGHSMSPGFVQYVTTAIFNELIKMEYTVHCSKTAADTGDQNRWAFDI